MQWSPIIRATGLGACVGGGGWVRVGLSMGKWPDIRFIVDEMNTNAQSADVRKMAELNRFSAEACITDFKELSHRVSYRR